MLDRCVPWRQAQGIGGNLQLALEVVPVAGLQDGFELGLLGRQLVEVRVGFGIGSVNLVQACLGVLDAADRFFHHFANGLVRIKLRLLRQVADIQLRHRPRFAIEFGVDTRHDFQQGGLARAVEAEHADLGAGKERQGDVLEDFTLRRNDFAEPVHGIDELSHGDECP